MLLGTVLSQITRSPSELLLFIPNSTVSLLQLLIISSSGNSQMVRKYSRERILTRLGNFIQNVSGHNAILNALAINSDGVMVSGADNGTMQWFDWRTGYNFQRYQAPVQPGSLDSESGIFALAFDKSESRLISCEGDKVNRKALFRARIYIQDYQTLQRRRGSNRRNKPDSLEARSRATKAILDQILFYCPFHNTFIQCVKNRSNPHVPICISALGAKTALAGSYVIIL